MKKVFLLLFLLLNTKCLVRSQIFHEKRIEFELKDGYTDEEILEFGKLGFIMSSRNVKSSGDRTRWRFEKFNSDLQLVKADSVLLEDKFHVKETFTNDERTHILTENRKGDFYMVAVEASNLDITRVEGVLPKKESIMGMAVLGDYAFINTRVKKGPKLCAVNWKTGEKKDIPLTIKADNAKDISLLRFQVLKDAHELFVYAKVLTKRKKNDLYVIRLNDVGEETEIFNLAKDIEQNITDISCSKLDDDKYIYTGTYSTNSTTKSEGLFFCQAGKSEIDFIKFYNFLDLKNFLSYLPERKQERLEKKRDRKEKKGKEFNIDYRMVAHEIMPLDDGYLFLGEAYYPTYNTISYTTTTTVNGIVTNRLYTQQVFDGYQYSHAMIGKFNKEGHLVWDEIFEMWNAYKPFHVKRFISIAEQNQNSLKLIFASRNKINAKSFDYEGTVILDSQSEEIQTSFPGDKTKSSYANLSYWYDNYFIAYGQQKIKNRTNTNDTKKKRKVYFVSKIRLD